MAKVKILKCSSCGGYTLNIKCPKCKISTRDPAPPKYSPLDRWGKWRRAAKRQLKEMEAADRAKLM